MRNAFSEELAAVVATRDDLVLLVGDIGFGVFDGFSRQHPDRYFNLGIAEANMIGTAAGLAMGGFVPIVYTIVPFLMMRPFEHIRVDLSAQKQKAVLVGVGGGLAYGSLGPTHHSIEDLGLAAALPHLAVFAPADPTEARQCFHAALAHPGPSYIRLGKNGEADLAGYAPVEIAPGLRRFGDPRPELAVFCAGPITEEALRAAALLRAEGRRVAVLSVSRIKPLPTAVLLAEAADAASIAVVEEHTVGSGLAAMLALAMARAGLARPLLVRGIEDRITEVVGSRDYLLRHHGLDAASLAVALRAHLPA